MAAAPLDDAQLLAVMKRAIAEVLDQRRDWFAELVAEAVEDLALTNAIRIGESSDPVSRDEVLAMLETK